MSIASKEAIYFNRYYIFIAYVLLGYAYSLLRLYGIVRIQLLQTAQFFAVILASKQLKKQFRLHCRRGQMISPFSEEREEPFICGGKCVFENASSTPLDKCAVLYSAFW